ncbi:MAG: FAD binding domain-containing protein [Deltaproteobacteria bacterium]|nr:MAG: FAD binding domain-containing protein [Deltaproteobacteria bacterium]
MIEVLLYELPSFELLDVGTVRDALACLKKYEGRTRVIAGGTDLLSLMKDRVEGPELQIPEVLVNIKNIPELNQITYDEHTGLRIGAAVKLNRLQTSDVIRQKFTVLSQAAGHVGTTQIRNMGTMGGNICQRPRCMYFRHPYFLCYKKGGDKCYAVGGEHRYYHSIMKNGRCVMAHPSDLAPALAALEAEVVIASSEGEKTLTLQDFFTPANDGTETVLKPGEFLTGVHVPNQKGKTYQCFLKHRIRHASDFALASVATVARITDVICEEIRIVLGGIAPFPYMAFRAVEILRGRKFTEKLISQAAAASIAEAHPLPQNRYKIDLATALVRRALASMWHKSSGI